MRGGLGHLDDGDVAAILKAGSIVVADANFDGEVEGSAPTWIAANSVESVELPIDLAINTIIMCTTARRKDSRATN